MARHLGTDKDIEKLARQARKQGWAVELTRNNHVRWVSPDKDQDIIIGGLTSCKSGTKQLQKRLKKAGLVLR